MSRALRNPSGRAVAHVMVLLGLGACVLALVGVRSVGAQADPTEPPATTAAVATTAAPTTTRAPTTARPTTTARPATTAPRPTTTVRRSTTTVRPTTTKADAGAADEGDVQILAETTVPTTVATTVPPPETTAVPSTSAAPALEERVSDSEQATTRLNRVIIGLVALAVLIAIATVVFWRLTRPGATQSGRSAAYWVDDDGAAMALPGFEDGDDIVTAGRGAVAGGAAYGATAPDPGAWSVGPPPTIPADVPAGSGSGPGVDPVLDPVAGAPLSPLPARTPGAGPYPGRDDDPARPGAPVVIVEPVQAPRPTAGWSDDLRSVGDGEPDPPERSEGWASQGWGTADEDHPDDR